MASDVRPHGTGPPMGWEWVTFGEEGNASPRASMPLSADLHLNVLGNSCDRMYLRARLD